MNPSIDSQTECHSAFQHSWARTTSQPTGQKLLALDHEQYIKIHKSEPFTDMGDLISSRQFWRQVDRIADGWLCQDAAGGIGVATVPKGTSLETTLESVISWSQNHDIIPRLVVLVAREETTSDLIEKRLHKMSAGLRAGRWTNVRLCVITRSDLLYIRNPPIKEMNNCQRRHWTAHESKT